MNIEDIYSTIQKYLQDPPVIIWGSGATIDFGLPSMSQLRDEIGNVLPEFDKKCVDLEAELGNEKYVANLPLIRKTIWNAVNSADLKAKEQLLKNADKFDGIKRLTLFCQDPHPKVMNVVTTNYDRILEYVWGYYGFRFTDGFEQHELAVFDEKKFLSKDTINLMKVHGSLDWFDIDHEARKLTSDFGYDPLMVPPGKNKYRTAYNSPYRELIQKSDNVIKQASSFLVVGFGFNDEHITPLVSKKTKDGTPIVVVTMKVTANAERQLERAKKVIYIESDSDIRKSRVRIIENGENVEDSVLEGQLWTLNNFMEVLS